MLSLNAFKNDKKNFRALCVGPLMWRPLGNWQRHTLSIP